MQAIIAQGLLFGGLVVITLFGLYLTLRVLPFLAITLPGLIADGFRDVAANYQESFVDARSSAAQRRRLRQLRQELDERMNPKRSRRPDRNFMKKSREAALVNHAWKLYAQRGKLCNQAHQIFKSMFPEARHMSDFEWEPDLIPLRQDVVDAAELALEPLEAAPVRTPDMLAMKLGLRSMRDICDGECDLLRYSTDSAPGACKVARWIYESEAASKTDPGDWNETH